MSIQLEDGIIGMGDAFHRGGARMDAFLEMTMSVHRKAMRFRCVGAASVLWTWLVNGQIQGMVLAHNNPYDVVAGHAIARRGGGDMYRLRGCTAHSRLTGSHGSRARHQGRTRQPRRRPGGSSAQRLSTGSLPSEFGVFIYG